MTTSIGNSFSGSLLEVLCDLEWGIDKSDVTDELLMEKINSIISTVKNDSVPSVAAEIKAAVRMNLQESDVRERVVQFFRSSRQVIEEQRWSEFFTDQEGLKLKCKLLVSSFEPQELCVDVEAILAYQNRAARTEERALFKIILEKALEHKREFQRRKRQRTGSRNGNQPNNPTESERPKKKLRVVRNDSAPAGPPPSSRHTVGKPAKSSQQGNSDLPTRKPEGGCRKCKVIIGLSAALRQLMKR